MLTETQSISLSILRASVKKLGLHEIIAFSNGVL